MNDHILMYNQSPNEEMNDRRKTGGHIKDETNCMQKKFGNLKLNETEDTTVQSSSLEDASLKFEDIKKTETLTQKCKVISKSQIEMCESTVNKTNIIHNPDREKLTKISSKSCITSQRTKFPVNHCRLWPKLPSSTISTEKHENTDLECTLPTHENIANNVYEHPAQETKMKSDVFKHFSSCLRKSKTSRNRLQSWPKLPSSDVHNNIKSNESGIVVLDESSRSISESKADEQENPILVKELIKKQRKLKKDYQKIERKKKQEEVQRKHEEELRRRMLAPKCQSLRIIDSSVKEKLSGSIQEIRKGTYPSNPQSSDFPSLSCSISKNKDGFKNEFQNTVRIPLPGNAEHSRTETQTKDKIHETGSGERNGEKGLSGDLFKLCKTSRKTESLSSKHVQRSSHKKPRKRDPITLNICEAIKALENKKRKPYGALKMLNEARKRRHLVSDAGNYLDSDRPLRKRGKVRMNKKKKITPIKMAILRERQIKAECKKIAKSELEHSGKILLNNNKYILDHDNVLLKLNRLNNTNDDRLSLNCSSVDSTVESKCTDFLIHEVSKENLYPENEPLENSCAHEDSSLENINLENIDETKSSEFINKTTQALVKTRYEVDPRKLLHSRKFMSYCDQWPIKELVESVNEILRTLLHFQERMHERDLIKAATKRRFNIGMREANKYLGFGKVKLLIIATDIEEVTGEGSLFEMVAKMRQTAEMHSVPYVFANTRYGLKGIMKKKSPISCIAIRNYEGAEEPFKRIVQLLPEAQNVYRKKLHEAELKCGKPMDNANSTIIQTMLEKLGSQCEETVKTDRITEDKEPCCPFLLALMK